MNSYRRPLLQLLFLLFPLVLIAENSADDIPQGAVQSYKYKVTVNGEESFVYMGCGAHFTQFSFVDSAYVTIEVLRGGFTGLKIRPLSKKIAYSRDGKKISFTLHQAPTQLSVEFEHRHNDPLFVFANPLEDRQEKPDSTADDVFYFGPGSHDAGIIELTERKKTVYLEKGAYVKGCIHATNLDGVKIFGRGVLSGDLYDNRPADSEWHNMVSFKGCTHVELKDIILHNAQAWNILLLATNHVDISNVKVVATIGNSDGIDICGAKHVTIDKCFFYNNDDCIAFNNLLCSFNYNWEHGEMRPNTSDIKVLNTVLWNQLWGQAIRLGWNTMCDYQSNMLFKDIDIIYSESGAIDMNHGDRGSFRNIVFENINIEDVDQLLTLRMDGNRTCIDPVRGVSETNGIHFKNIRSVGKINNKKNLIHGLNEVNSFNNISFSNFKYKGKDVKSLSDLNCDTRFANGVIFSDDKTAPRVPEISSVKAKGAYAVELQWQASVDLESDVIFYNVYRDGEFLDIAKTTSYRDNSCKPSSEYNYEIKAINAVGLESSASASVVVKTPRMKHKYVLSESIAKQTQGYNNFYFLTYNTKPMKFYRMPESGLELADTRYTYSTLKFWDMYHDGLDMWHSISNTRDTKNRIDARLTEDGQILPDKNMAVVVAWKVPVSGEYMITTKAELLASEDNITSLAFARNEVDERFDETIQCKDKESIVRCQTLSLSTDDYLYFIGGRTDNHGVGNVDLELIIEKKR